MFGDFDRSFRSFQVERDILAPVVPSPPSSGSCTGAAPLCKHVVDIRQCGEEDGGKKDRCNGATKQGFDDEDDEERPSERRQFIGAGEQHGPNPLTESHRMPIHRERHEGSMSATRESDGNVRIDCQQVEG